MLSASEWATHTPLFDADDDKPPPSAFDAPKGGPGDATADDTCKSAGSTSVLRAPADAEHVACAHCGEEVEMFWDPGEEEWFLRDAVLASDGRICHASCQK